MEGGWPSMFLGDDSKLFSLPQNKMKTSTDEYIYQ